MKFYLITWPNGTISIIEANDLIELYDMMDCEGNPEGAKIHEIKGQCHITTDIRMKKGKPCISAGVVADGMACDTTLKRVKLPSDAFERNFGFVGANPEVVAKTKRAMGNEASTTV